MVSQVLGWHSYISAAPERQAERKRDPPQPPFHIVTSDHAVSGTYATAGAPAALDVVLTPRTVVREEINVVSSRLDIPYAVNPASTAVVVPQTFDELPRGVGAEEALAAVPGVKVDNQANGERARGSTAWRTSGLPWRMTGFASA